MNITVPCSIVISFLEKKVYVDIRSGEPFLDLALGYLKYPLEVYRVLRHRLKRGRRPRTNRYAPRGALIGMYWGPCGK